jgi:leader peptidase (prepilin peptidase) / N-methyltransferase
VLCAAASGGIAALGTQRLALDPRARRLWWVAGVIGALGPVVAVPAVYGLPAGALAAAAVVDAVEGRIPTPLAYMGTALAVVALVGQSVASGDRGPLLRAVALTVLFVGILTIVWLAGGIGFGDVRLACATATATARGLAGLVTMAWLAFLVAGVIVVATRRSGDSEHRKGRTVPFGPALVAGWFLAIWTA